MAPSLHLPSPLPRVPSSNNVEPFGQTRTPPSEQVATLIETESKLQSLFSLKGGAVIVTGAARGLGLTLASAIIEAGADVFCCDILDNPSSLEWKALQLKASQYGAIARYYQVDITDVNGVSMCFDRIAAQSRRPINGFVNAAATQHEQLAIDYDMDKFRRLLQINIDGTMITAQAAARLMRNSGQGGSILLVASMSGVVANKNVFCSAYNASKAACLQLGRSLAVEWAQYNIRVNTLSPGYIRTAMTNMLLEGRPELLEQWQEGNPMNRIARPSEFKGPAIFLLSNASSFMTGSDLRVDGGHTAW